MQCHMTDAYAVVLRLRVASVARAEVFAFGFFAAISFAEGFFATGFFTAAFFAVGFFTAVGETFFPAKGATFVAVFRATVFTFAAGFFALITFAIAGADVLATAFVLAFDLAFTVVLTFAFAVGFTLATALAFDNAVGVVTLRFGATGLGNSSVPSLHNSSSL